MNRKAIAGIMLVVILVSMFNVPLMVAEIDDDGRGGADVWIGN